MIGKLALLAALAWSAPVQALDYTYQVYKGRLAITAAGSIELGDTARFERFLKTVPQDMLALSHNFVFFDSSGGVVVEALRLGAVVQQNHFITGVTGHQCSSACVLAWAAGERKYAFEGQCIGVHSADAPLAKTLPKAVAKKMSKESQGTTNLDMAVWLWDHGAPGIVTDKIFHTPPADLYCLKPADLARWNVKVMP